MLGLHFGVRVQTSLKNQTTPILHSTVCTIQLKFFHRMKVSSSPAILKALHYKRYSKFNDNQYLSIYLSDHWVFYPHCQRTSQDVLVP